MPSQQRIATGRGANGNLVVMFIDQQQSLHFNCQDSTGWHTWEENFRDAPKMTAVVMVSLLDVSQILPERS